MPLCFNPSRGPAALRDVGAHILNVVVLAFSCLHAAFLLDAAKLKPATVEAYNQYVQKTEARIDNELKSGYPFLWVDSLSTAEKTLAYTRLRNGEILVQSRAAELDIPGGMIHDWIGVVFIPNATLDEALAQIQSYNNYAQIYAPAINRSKILKHDGDKFTVSLRLQKKSLRTVVIDVVDEVQYFRLDPAQAYSRSQSIRITEVENPETPQEREVAPGCPASAGNGESVRPLR